MIEKERLITIRNYAEMKGVTVPAVYLWEKQKKVSTTKIDGVKFVVLNDEEMKRYKSK